MRLLTCAIVTVTCRWQLIHFIKVTMIQTVCPFNMTDFGAHEGVLKWIVWYLVVAALHYGISLCSFAKGHYGTTGCKEGK